MGVLRFLQQSVRGGAGDDLELLEIEVETLWGDPRRDGAPALVMAASDGGLAVAVRSDVPDSIAAELEQAVAAAPAGADPASAPPALSRCQQVLLRALGAVSLTSGPSYVVPPTITFPPTAKLVLAGSENAGDLRGANPGNWPPEEWDQLLEGTLGPWAMAVHNGQVIAVCHTPASSARGAEAGVWTHPDHRGCGHAATVTAAWASLMAPGGQVLFYSTSATNRSSQRVAARLGLRRIGWLWRLSRPARPGA